jgi:uncharacterized protein (DUF362 family)
MNDDDKNNQVTRRSFVQTVVTAVALTGCSNAPPPVVDKLPTPTGAQRSLKRQGASTVGIFQAATYEEDIYALLKDNLPKLNVPDCKDKLVVLKPNLIECPVNKPATTHPEVLKAVIRLVDHLGAKEILVAEGPGHMRDTDYILGATGIGAACKEMGVQFVDLNLDDIVKVPVSNGFSRLKEFHLPRTILDAEVLMNLPKLKTHHWVGVTVAMKNWFGLVPGREYGFPKNFLHVYGIPQCIIDLNRIVKTDLIVVDGITAMEGDGPVNGTARDVGLIIVGDDPAAVDATCARIMGYRVDELDYIGIAGDVLGNVQKNDIHIVGCAIDDVALKFKRPVTYEEGAIRQFGKTAGAG